MDFGFSAPSPKALLKFRPGQRNRRPSERRQLRRRLLLEPLEDRRLLAVTAFFDGTQTLNLLLSAPGDHATLTYDNLGNYHVNNGSSDVYVGNPAGLTTIAAAGNSAAGQFVTFSGSNAFPSLASLTVTNVTTAEVKQLITATTVSGNAGTVNVALPGRIQVGVELAASGGPVNVAAGSYDEYLIVDKAVQLRGAKWGLHPAVGTNATETVDVTRGAGETILTRAGENTGNYAISVQANDVSVDGFMFAGSGGQLIKSYATANRFHLTNSIFQDPDTGVDEGVVQFGAGDHTQMLVDFNLFQDMGYHSLYLGGSGAYDGLTLQYNKFNGYNDSVFWDKPVPMVDALVQGNEFDGTIAGLGGPGAGGPGMNIGQGGNIQIVDNWFHDMYYTAFQVGIDGGAVLRNTFEHTYPVQDYYGPGLDLPSMAFELWGGQDGTTVSRNVTIQNNVIKFNDIPGASVPTHGILLGAPDSGSGIDATTIHITNNTFVNGGVRNDAYAIRHQGNAATTVEASDNWWSTVNDSAILALMDGSVDFSPYLNSGVNSAVFPGFEGDFSALHVTWKGGEVGSAGRIKEGINDVTVNGIVYIEAGSYDEYVSVDKSVKLRGAKWGLHPAVGTNATETVDVTRGAGETILTRAGENMGNYAISVQANDVSVDGFLFTGSGGQLIKSYATANRFHLTNSIFRDADTGIDEGVVQFGAGDHTQMLVDYNLFKDMGYDSLYLGGSGAYDGLTLQYNKFNGYNDSVFWDKPVPMVDALVQGNEFDGTIAGLGGPGAGGPGMNIGQGGNIQIVDNWFHDMYYTAFQVGIDGGAVLRNTFEHTYPVQDYYGPGLDLPSMAFELWGGQDGTTVSRNVTIQNNVIKFNDIPGANVPTHGILLGAPDSGSGIDATTIHITNNTFVNGGVRNDAYAIRHQGNALTTVAASDNWWSTVSDSEILALMDGSVDFTPYLDSGNNSATFPAFLGDYSTLHVTAMGGETRPDGRRIQEGIVDVDPSGTLIIEPGSYTGDVDATAKALTLWPGGSRNIASGIGNVISNGSFKLDANDTLKYYLHAASPNGLPYAPPFQYDSLNVTGASSTVTLGGAQLSLTGDYLPDNTVLQALKIIDNAGPSAVGGTFLGQPEWSTITFNGKVLYITYASDGNDVVLTTQPFVDGSDLWNDTLVLRATASHTDLEFSLNGAAFVDVGPIASLPGFTFNGLNGQDLMIVDYVNGNPIPPANLLLPGGVYFNGGPDTLQANPVGPVPPNDPTPNLQVGDALQVLGTDGTLTPTYTPSDAAFGNGTVTMGSGKVLTFTGLDSYDQSAAAVELTDMATVTVTFPNANDTVNLHNGSRVTENGATLDALVVSGNSGGVGGADCLPVAVRNATRLTIDTSTVDGQDAVTVTGANGMATGANVTNISINTAGATTGDTLTISGSLQILGDLSLNVNGAGGGVSESGVGEIRAAGLQLLGAGPDTLTGTTNNVATLAANVNGAVSYQDADALTVGTVLGSPGIVTSNNNVTLNTGGTLTIGDGAGAKHQRGQWHGHAQSVRRRRLGRHELDHQRDQSEVAGRRDVRPHAGQHGGNSGREYSRRPELHRCGCPDHRHGAGYRRHYHQQQQRDPDDGGLDDRRWDGRRRYQCRCGDGGPERGRGQRSGHVDCQCGEPATPGYGHLHADAGQRRRDAGGQHGRGRELYGCERLASGDGAGDIRDQLRWPERRADDGRIADLGHRGGAGNHRQWGDGRRERRQRAGDCEFHDLCQ